MSIPDVAFIVGDIVTFQEFAEFLLKSPPFVMLLLMLDVVNYRISSGLADGESPIPTLPMKLTELLALGLDPFGGTSFDGFRNLGNGQRSRKPKKEVDVVFYTANSKGRTILVGQDGGQVGM